MLLSELLSGAAAGADTRAGGNAAFAGFLEAARFFSCALPPGLIAGTSSAERSPASLRPTRHGLARKSTWTPSGPRSAARRCYCCCRRRSHALARRGPARRGRASRPQGADAEG